MSKIVQKLQQNLKLNPQQILEQNIIQLSVFNLEKRILEELEQNPALEIIESEESLDDKDSEDNEEFDFEELVSNPEEFEYSNKPSTSETLEKIVEADTSNLFDASVEIWLFFDPFLIVIELKKALSMNIVSVFLLTLVSKPPIIPANAMGDLSSEIIKLSLSR